jgi:hypothetical protein
MSAREKKKIFHPHPECKVSERLSHASSVLLNNIGSASGGRSPDRLKIADLLFPHPAADTPAMNKDHAPRIVYPDSVI